MCPYHKTFYDMACVKSESKKVISLESVVWEDVKLVVFYKKMNQDFVYFYNYLSMYAINLDLVDVQVVHLTSTFLVFIHL